MSGCTGHSKPILQIRRAATLRLRQNRFDRFRHVFSGDISRHKDRVFISEVFRFEELGLEEVEEGF